jgi:pimeloyl-ACP methyl ester carboxylesterase
VHERIEHGIVHVTVETPRLSAHVLVAGPPDAVPVVFIHGNVSSARFFGRTLADGASRWRGIAVDLRGFGHSEPKPVDATRGLSDFSDDLDSVLDAEMLHLDGSPVHMVGWSMGGGVAMRYTIDHPGRVRSLTLLAPMSPYGFGGTRDDKGTPCQADFAGSGGGTAKPELVTRLRERDRGAESPFSPRSILRSAYMEPPARLDPAEEDTLVDAMLDTAIGDASYPGTSEPSEHWPFVRPGALGVNNAISPRYCDLGPFAEVDPRPEVLWIRGDADRIVSDHSLADLGYLGEIGMIPGWPGPDVFPAQPMVSQTRAVLDRYVVAGGHYQEEVIAHCGHSPHLEHPSEVLGLLGAFVGRKP